MAISTDDLLLIIGSECNKELTTLERNAICAKYSAGQEAECELFCMKFLSLKFRASYKMGSTFEAESDKFRFYNQRYLALCASVSAGRTGLAANEAGSDPSRNDVERQKWVESTRR